MFPIDVKTFWSKLQKLNLIEQFQHARINKSKKIVFKMDKIKLKLLKKYAILMF